MKLNMMVASAAMFASISVGAVELIKNGDFNSQDHWWAVGSQAVTQNGQTCIITNSALSNPWDLILGQNNIVLETNADYHLHFTAWSKDATQFKTLLQHNAPPYTAYFSQLTQTSPSPKDFDFDYRHTTMTNPVSQIQFQLGGQKSTEVCFKNISLVKR